MSEPKKPARKPANPKDTQKKPAAKPAAKASAPKQQPAPSQEPVSAFPSYKGKPLVRCGDTIYYGSMKDKFVIKMDVKSKKNVGGLDVADKVTVQLMYTDPSIRARKQIVKTSEKEGLYLALDIADVWLSRALAEE